GLQSVKLEVRPPTPDVMLPSALSPVNGSPFTSTGLLIPASPAPPNTRSPRVVMLTVPSPGITVGPGVWNEFLKTSGPRVRGSSEVKVPPLVFAARPPTDPALTAISPRRSVIAPQ